MRFESLNPHQLHFLNELCGDSCRRLRLVVKHLDARRFDLDDAVYKACRGAMEALALACAATHRQLNDVRGNSESDATLQETVAPVTRYARDRMDRLQRGAAERERHERGYYPNDQF